MTDQDRIEELEAQIDGLRKIDEYQEARIAGLWQSCRELSMQNARLRKQLEAHKAYIDTCLI